MYIRYITSLLTVSFLINYSIIQHIFVACLMLTTVMTSHYLPSPGNPHIQFGCISSQSLVPVHHDLSATEGQHRCPPMLSNSRSSPNMRRDVKVHNLVNGIKQTEYTRYVKNGSSDMVAAETPHSGWSAYKRVISDRCTMTSQAYSEILAAK